MKLFRIFFLTLCVAIWSPAFANVVVNAPADGSAVGPNVQFAANSNTDCAAGVAAMGVYLDNSLIYVAQGTTLNTSLTLPAGQHTAVVQEWDYCGVATLTPLQLTVSGAPQGTKLANIQAVGNWNQWGELAPSYNICDAPCGGAVNWSMYQHQTNGSLSGDATQFNMGGSVPYSDVLWSNKLIGQGSTLGMPDRGHKILPNVHHMAYDTDINIQNFAVAQDLEFDVNLFMFGVGMEWGMECNHLGGGVWDIWNNIDAHWVHTSVPCTLNDYAWNHVHFEVQREANNDLTYQSITVNGVTYQINQTVAPFPVPNNWYGMTVNFQMDGDKHQDSYGSTLDNLSIAYW